MNIRKPAPGFGSEPDHVERGRAEFQRALDEGGDTLSAVLAWIRTSFDDQARADILRERDERNRKMGEVA